MSERNGDGEGEDGGLGEGGRTGEESEDKAKGGAGAKKEDREEASQEPGTGETEPEGADPSRLVRRLSCHLRHLLHKRIGGDQMAPRSADKAAAATRRRRGKKGARRRGGGSGWTARCFAPDAAEWADDARRSPDPHRRGSGAGERAGRTPRRRSPAAAPRAERRAAAGRPRPRGTAQGRRTQGTAQPGGGHGRDRAGGRQPEAPRQRRPRAIVQRPSRSDGRALDARGRRVGVRKGKRRPLTVLARVTLAWGAGRCVFAAAGLRAVAASFRE